MAANNTTANNRQTKALSRAGFAFWAVAAIFFYSCGLKPIESVNHKYSYKIAPGDTALVKWKFANADSVIVSGLDKRFSAEDSVHISPEKTTKYALTAKSNEINEQYTVSTSVEVDPAYPKKPKPEPVEKRIANPQVEIVKTDDNSSHGIPGNNDSDEHLPIAGFPDLAHKRPETNTEACAYFAGITTDKTAVPAKLKIMSTIYPRDSKDEFKLQLSLLDENGNFILKTTDNKTDSRWIIDQACNSDKLTYSHFTAKTGGLSRVESLDLGVLIDMSAQADGVEEVTNAVSAAIQAMDPKDKISLWHYNQDYIEAFGLVSPDSASRRLRTFGRITPNGSAGLYKAAYNYLHALSKGSCDKKALIIVCFTGDNSSLLYTYNDVAETARKMNIPVFVVGIGEDVNGHSIRLSAGLAEGRGYLLDVDEIGETAKVFREIIFSRKYFYEISFPMSSLLENCDEPNNVISYEWSSGKVSEKARLYPVFSTPYAPYQAVAFFEENSSIPPPSYNTNIELLAAALKDNPEMTILLIGHSAAEGDEVHCEGLAYDRAQAVRLKLIDAGIDENRIRVRSAGASKPVYLFESKPARREYNRRTELRWLDPSVLPWEIVAGTENNEEDAGVKVDYWEKKGKKAYFDRYMKAGDPQYKVKLWGFPSYDDAQKAAKKLEKEFKRRFIVE